MQFNNDKNDYCPKKQHIFKNKVKLELYFE